MLKIGVWSNRSMMEQCVNKGPHCNIDKWHWEAETFPFCFLLSSLSSRNDLQTTEGQNKHWLQGNLNLCDKDALRQQLTVLNELRTPGRWSMPLKTRASPNRSILCYSLSQHPEQRCVFICKSVCICVLVSVIMFLFSLSLLHPPLSPLVAVQCLELNWYSAYFQRMKRVYWTLAGDPWGASKNWVGGWYPVLKIVLANGVLLVSHELVASETQKTVKKSADCYRKVFSLNTLGICIF